MKESHENECTQGEAKGATEAAIDPGWRVVRADGTGWFISRAHIAANLEAEVAAGIDPITGQAIIEGPRQEWWSRLCLGLPANPKGGTPEGDRPRVRGTGDS